MLKASRWRRFFIPALAVGIIALFSYGIYHTVYAYNGIEQSSIENCPSVSDMAVDQVCPITGSICDPLTCPESDVYVNPQYEPGSKAEDSPNIQINALD